MERLRFTVPLIPCGVNHYLRHTRKGRHYVTPEAKAFKEAVAIFARGEHVQAKAFLVSLRITLGKGDRGDVDGFPKLCLDGLADAGAFRNLKGERISDAHVRSLTVVLDCDSRPEQGYTEFEVAVLKEERAA